MRRLLCWQFSALLLLAGMTAGAQVPNSSQNVQPSNSAPNANTESIAASEAKNAPLTLKPGVTVTAKRLHSEPPLPKLPPDEFTNCMSQIGLDADE